MILQEPDGDPRLGPGEGALQPLPRHQRELHRAAQVRSGFSCEGVANPLCASLEMGRCWESLQEEHERPTSETPTTRYFGDQGDFFLHN